MKRKLENIATPAKPNAPIANTSREKLKLTIQTFRLENKELKSEIENLNKLIQNNNVAVDVSLSQDLCDIMSNATQTEVQPFMKFYWEEQQKYLKASRNGVRYHPAIIRYCLSWLQNPQVCMMICDMMKIQNQEF